MFFLYFLYGGETVKLVPKRVERTRWENDAAALFSQCRISLGEKNKNNCCVRTKLRPHAGLEYQRIAKVERLWFCLPDFELSSYKQAAFDIRLLLLVLVWTHEW